jgi:hypothetical protein
MKIESIVNDGKLDQLNSTDDAATRVIQEHRELYHYTGEAGLRGIVESNSFWATYFADLNDAHEIQELRAPLVNELAGRLTAVVREMRAQKPIDHIVWTSGVAQHLAQRWGDNLYKVVFADEESTRTTWCCATSFCSHVADQPYEREHGLLSQWRGYGKDGGFCLVFDTADIWKLFEQERFTYFYAYTDLQEAHYPRGGAKPLNSFAELLDISETVIKRALSNDRNFTVDPVLLPFLASATAFKHQGFYEEREVRLVAMPGTQLAADKMKGVKGFQPKALKAIHTDKRDGRDRRYISLFGKDFAPLPLRRVIVGPSRKQDENAAIAVKIVGGKTLVSKSATPYLG